MALSYSGCSGSSLPDGVGSTPGTTRSLKMALTSGLEIRATNSSKLTPTSWRAR